MSFETFAWGIVPLGVALAAVATSWWSAATHPGSVRQWALLIPVTAAGGLAVMMLVAMFRGAWPTYAAHILTAVAALLALIQLGQRGVGPGRR